MTRSRSRAAMLLAALFFLCLGAAGGWLLQRQAAPSPNDGGGLVRENAGPQSAASQASLEQGGYQSARDRQAQRVPAPSGLLVTGRVYDAAGTGIEAAQLHFGVRNKKRLTGLEPPGLLEDVGECTTAEDGRYSIAIAKPGVFDVVVEAPGWCRRESHVALQGSRDGLDFVLATGATLSGIVRDETGTPVENAYVLAVREPPLNADLFRFPAIEGSIRGGSAAVTGRDGAYRVSQLPSGHLYLIAGVWPNRESSVRQAGPVAIAEATKSMYPGEAGLWDPIVRYSRISVVLQTERGQPYRLFPGSVYAVPKDLAGGAGMRSHMVRFAAEKRGPGDGAWVGAFCRPVPYKVVVEFRQNSQVSMFERDDVLPSRDDVIMQIPEGLGEDTRYGQVKGSMADAGGRFTVDHPALAMLVSRQTSLECRISDGRFAFNKVLEGTWQLLIMRDNTPVIIRNDIEVVHGEEIELGVLSSQPAGGAIIHIDRGSLTAAERVTSVFLKGEGYFARATAAPNGLFLASNLTPATYAVMVQGDGCYGRGEVRVVEGKAVSCGVNLGHAAMMTLEVWGPPPSSWTDCCLRVKRHDGVVLNERPSFLSSEVGWRSMLWNPTLPYGTHLLEVVLDGKVHAGDTMAMSSDEGASRRHTTILR